MVTILYLLIETPKKPKLETKLTNYLQVAELVELITSVKSSLITVP